VEEHCTNVPQSERVLDFPPDALPGHWGEFRGVDTQNMDIVRRRLIGVF
jgi:hypothetical protein